METKKISMLVNNEQIEGTVKYDTAKIEMMFSEAENFKKFMKEGTFIFALQK